MKIMFIGTTGVHHALIAANIFLNRINEPRFKLVRGYADNQLDLDGHPILVDDDGQGNQIYTLGVGKNLDVGKKVFEHFVQLLGESQESLTIKPVPIKGEKIFLLLQKIPEALGGKIINPFVSNIIIKRQFPQLVEDVNVFKQQLLRTMNVKQDRF